MMWCLLCVRGGHRVKLSQPPSPLKRGDYSTCSTLVVWDVDVLSAAVAFGQGWYE